MGYIPLQKVIRPATIALLVVSCGESKVSQCDRIVKLINQADAATQSASMNRSATLLEAANKLDRVAWELKAVKLKDEKLQGLQSSYLMMYGDLSKSFRNIAVAVQRNEPQSVESSLKFLQQVKSQDRTLVEEINSYCLGK